MTNRLANRTIGLAWALWAALLLVSAPVAAAPRQVPPPAAHPILGYGPDARMENRAPAGRPMLVAEGDCSGAAAKARSQTGGQVLSVQSRQQGGRTVCVVTVLVPSPDGGRPRKTTITVPQ
ncbi:hypothetical protein [Consotaella aegiceratis]|uniref:hypothetical protein n=1 Tax=Consotaella aegiceratis TaxID=3097961 RepID=UPI002F423A91